MRASEIMTKEPEFVTPQDTLSRAAALMRDRDVGIIPVVDDVSGRRLRGVITDRDIAIRHVAERHSEDCPVSSHMSESVSTVGPDAEAEEVMRIMRDKQVRRVPVVDDGGRLVGIVAQADVAVDLRGREGGEVERTVAEISEPARPRR